MDINNQEYELDYQVLAYCTMVGISIVILLGECCYSEHLHDDDEDFHVEDEHHHHHHHHHHDQHHDNEQRARRKKHIESKKQRLEKQIVVKRVIRRENPITSDSSSITDSLRSHASRSRRVYASFLSASLRGSERNSVEFTQPISSEYTDIELGNDLNASSSSKKSRRTCNYVARQISARLGNLDDTCGICLMEYEDGEHIGCSHNPDCVHHFHKECILNWLGRNHNTCPVCRRDFLME